MDAWGWESFVRKSSQILGRGFSGLWEQCPITSFASKRWPMVYIYGTHLGRATNDVAFFAFRWNQAFTVMETGLYARCSLRCWKTRFDLPTLHPNPLHYFDLDARPKSGTNLYKPSNSFSLTFHFCKAIHDKENSVIKAQSETIPSAKHERFEMWQQSTDWMVSKHQRSDLSLHLRNKAIHHKGQQLVPKTELNSLKREHRVSSKTQVCYPSSSVLAC